MIASAVACQNAKNSRQEFQKQNTMADRASAAPSGEESAVREVENASPVPATAIAGAAAPAEPSRPPAPVVVYAAPPPKDAAVDSGGWVLVHGPAQPTAASSSSLPSDSVIEDAGVCCRVLLGLLGDCARVLNVLFCLRPIIK
jgi:hypothetical protein